MVFRWQANDGPLIVVFGSSLSSSTKKKQCQSWTPADKTAWIGAWEQFCQDILLSVLFIQVFDEAWSNIRLIFINQKLFFINQKLQLFLFL